MNPYVALGAVLVLVGAFAGGFSAGVRMERGAQARAELATQEAEMRVRSAVADQIATIRVRNVTVQQKLEREVRVEPRYVSDGCRLTPDVLRDLNAALAGPDGESVVPEADAAR